MFHIDQEKNVIEIYKKPKNSKTFIFWEKVVISYVKVAYNIDIEPVSRCCNKI